MNILITGASGGIGAELTTLLASNPAHTIVALARTKIATKTSNTIPYAFDLQKDNYKDLFSFVSQSVGHIDVLINNAALLISIPFAALSEQDWLDCYRTNVIAPAQLIQTVLPILNPLGAHIVNIGSMSGVEGSQKFTGLAAYGASKAALHNLTECLAEELKDTNTKVNCLALGATQTPMLAKAFPEHKTGISPAKMAEFIAHFALTGHHFFNGKIIPVALTTP